jgi:erythromycin esterase-like protein
MLAEAALDVLREASIPLLDGEAGDFDPLLRIADGASVVFLGIALLGSHELFQARAELTRRLIADMGFSSLYFDDDAAPLQAMNDYLAGRTERSPAAAAALGKGALMPTWTWRNAEMLAFLSWLRSYNDLFEGDRHKVSVHAMGQGLRERSVVWADSRRMVNPHLGGDGEPGIGEVARARFGRRAVLVGLTTYSGITLTDRDGQLLHAPLGGASPDSIEALLHAVHMPHFVVRLRDAPERVTSALRGTPAEQFDALIHFDRTRALEPLL